jgi:predicted O-linked N-acetylglucosamine transferase (SPINDLY family)
MSALHQKRNLKQCVKYLGTPDEPKKEKKKEKRQKGKRKKNSFQSSCLTSSLSLGVPVPRPTQCMGGA